MERPRPYESWLAQNFPMFFAYGWLGFLGLDLASGRYEMAVYAGVFAFCFYTMNVHVQLILLLDRLLEVLQKTAESQLGCIEHLAQRLVPYIGQEEVEKILRIYGIEVAKHWDDFDKKGGTGKRRKFSEWTRKFSEQLKSNMGMAKGEA